MRHCGAVVLSVAVCLVVFLGFSAFAIDIGYQLAVRTECQRMVDASALAGATAVTEDDISLIYIRAIETALKNPVNTKLVYLDSADITLGWIDNAFSPVFETGTGKINAVKVLYGLSDIPVFFSGVFGYTNLFMNASVIATFNDRVVGFRPPLDRKSPLTPFTLPLEKWEEEKFSGPDNYSFDGRNVLDDSDGIPEVKLYISEATGGSTGVGNYGLLNVGSGSLGTPILGNQIENGISRDDLYDMNGEEMFTFVDGSSYEVTGDPGIKSGLESYIDTRLGDVIGFFLHDELTMSGSNTIYHIVNIKFGRVAHVDIHSANKTIIVQPVTFFGREIVTGEDASHSGDVGRLVLVK